MKKTKLLTSIAAFALVLGLGACDELVEEKSECEGDQCSSESIDEEKTDLELAHDFIGSLNYNVSWDAFHYFYDWANITDGEGEAMERDLYLTEDNYQPLGYQEETWYNVLEYQTTSPSYSVFYYRDGYGFDTDEGECWVYSDTYDDAIDYYLEDIDVQIAWEISGEEDEFVTNVELEYTDGVITGATIDREAVTEGVGTRFYTFTYRTDTTGVLTQYVYEMLDLVEQEYQGEDVELVVYAKHDLGLHDAAEIKAAVPELDPDSFGDSQEPGYDIEVPAIPGSGEVASTQTLEQTAAEELISAISFDQIYSWEGYAHDHPSTSEGGIETIEYFSTLDSNLFGISEQYLGIGEEGVLTTGKYYSGGYSYEYGPATGGEGVEVGSATRDTTTLRSKLETEVSNINYYQHDYDTQKNDEYNGSYFKCTEATKTTYEDNSYSIEIKYILDFDNADWEQIDHTNWEYTYYFGEEGNLTGFHYYKNTANNFGASGEPSFNNPTVESGLECTIYEVTLGNVMAVLPDWVGTYFG